jgi:hypothetical protein
MASCDLAAIAAVGDSVTKVACRKPTIFGWPKGWVQLHHCGLFRGLEGSGNIASLQKRTISGWPKVWPQRRGVPALILDCPTSSTQRR